jgi:hypothetical protein
VRPALCAGRISNRYKRTDRQANAYETPSIALAHHQHLAHLSPPPRTPPGERSSTVPAAPSTVLGLSLPSAIPTVLMMRSECWTPG